MEIHDNTVHSKKENKKLILFFIILLITFAAYSVLGIQNYAFDSYYCSNGNDIDAPLSSGRLVWALLLKIFDSLGVNVAQEQEYFVLLFIVSCAWCAYRLVTNLKPDFKMGQGIVLSLPVLIGFINPHLQEWFLYPESTMYYAVGIFCAVEGAILLMKGHYLRPLFLVIISVLCYQVILSVFVISALFLSFIRYPRKGIARYCATVVIGIIGGVVSILAQKYTVQLLEIQTPRSSELSVSTILGRIPEAADKMLDVFMDAQGLIFPVVLPAVIIISLVLIIRNIFLSDALRDNRVLGALQILFGVIISMGIVVAPIMISDTMWFAPRMLVGFFVLVAMLAASAMVLEKTRLANVLAVAVALLLFTNIYTNSKIATDRFENNAIDHFVCQVAESYIEDYEAETGNKVDSIAFYTDMYQAWEHSPQVSSFYDTNVRTFMVGWVRIEIVKHLIDPGFIEVAGSDEVFAQHFEGKDWVAFQPDEQMVFIDNTLHWCIY